MRKTMQKLTAVLVLLGIIIGTTACSADRKFKEKSKVSLSNYDDYKVDMTVEVVRNRKLMVNLVNKSDRTYMYGRAYSLEYQRDGEWYQVPMDVAFTMEGILLGPHIEFADLYALDTIEITDKSSEPVYLDEVGKLPAGHYRIIKDITVHADEGVGATYYMAAEFDLDEEAKDDPKLKESVIPANKIMDEKDYKIPVASVNKSDEKSLVINFDNYSAFGIFVLEYKKDGTWYDMPIRSKGGTASADPTDENILMLVMEDPLPSGTYRLLHNVGLLTSDNDYYYSYTFKL